MYTAQKNAHGNVIICKGCEQRNSYTIIFTGSYAECLRVRAYTGIEAATLQPGGYGCPEEDRVIFPVRKKLTLREYDLARSAGKATPYV